MNKLLYTVCFLFRDDSILMLLRNKPPNQGLWNGVGGHIEPGEAPYKSCLREVQEETGFEPQKLTFGGILTWTGFEIEAGGLFIFTGIAPTGDPHPTPEGKLAWLSRQTVCSSPEVVENIHYFGPQVFSGSPPRCYHFEYKGRKILNHLITPMPPSISPLKAIFI